MAVNTEKPVVFSDTVNTYRIIGIKQPKHFQVSLENVKSGERFMNLSVSKHCNRWRDVEIGSLWNIHEVVYEYKEAQKFSTRLEGLSSICPH